MAEWQAGFAARLLDAHNRERTAKGLSGVVWSAKLAREAQGWADRLARSGRLEHAALTGETGENLWMGTAGRYSANEMIGGFINEKRDFRPGRFPDVSRTGRWEDVGHYSQMIWPDTRQVGCAVSRGPSTDVMVCRYFPSGNWIGERVG